MLYKCSVTLHCLSAVIFVCVFVCLFFWLSVSAPLSVSFSLTNVMLVVCR